MPNFKLSLPQTEPMHRMESCSFCNCDKGSLISQVDYWDVHSAALVQCSQCQHIQLDPKLNHPQTEKGCEAYYLKEVFEINPREQFRNQVRSFRRGVLFGFSLKLKKIHPRHVLEMGPGSGYFLDGLKFVFPDISITVMDIVDEVLEACSKIHQCQVIKGNPDGEIGFVKQKFDLIIARDLIEHVNEPIRLIQNVSSLLNPRGFFHFITPNGHEDVWGHYVLWKTQQKKSELLINHVNYFDGTGLLNELTKKDFTPIEYYSYQMKNALKGKGWKLISKWSKISSQLAMHTYLSRRSEAKPAFSKSAVYDTWYISKKRKWLTYLICFYHHNFFIRLSPARNIGHEIYGLFQKK